MSTRTVKIWHALQYPGTYVTISLYNFLAASRYGPILSCGQKHHHIKHVPRTTLIVCLYSLVGVPVHVSIQPTVVGVRVCTVHTAWCLCCCVCIEVTCSFRLHTVKSALPSLSL